MKAFRRYLPEQTLMLPPSLDDWLPEDHLARFISDIVGEMDLSEIFASYEKDGRGQSAYHPQMMMKLIIYGYCCGIRSSRQIERRTYEDVAFRYLAANQHPDHATIAEFRRRHLQAAQGIFIQVLQMCRETGLAKLGLVALDGTKMKGNAGLSANRTYEKLCAQEPELAAQVAELLSTAEKTDVEEDGREAAGQLTTGLPRQLQTQQGRLEKIREAKARMEQEARAAAEQEGAEAQPQAPMEGGEPPTESQTAAVTGPGHVSREGTPVTPDPKQKTNLSDPDSRVMKDRNSKGWVQGFNAQAAVDGEAQVIVAAEVTQAQNDRGQLVPMIAQIQQNSGAQPEKLLADTDYYAPTQVSSPVVGGIDLYIRPDRPPKQAEAARARAAAEGRTIVPKKSRSGYTLDGVPWVQHLRDKLHTPVGRALYARRREIIEPVFGQIKQARGIRHFLFRGLEKVRAEWKLICLTHNLLKLYRGRWLPAAA